MGGMKPSQRHGVEAAAQKKLAVSLIASACFLSTEPEEEEEEEEEEVKSTSTMTTYVKHVEFLHRNIYIHIRICT